MDNLIYFVITVTVLSFTPGPDNIYVLSQSMAKGTKVGMAITLGLMTGLALHTTAVALGLAAILNATKIGVVYISYLGAAYLIYLGIKSLGNENESLLTNQSIELSAKTYYKRGLVMNLLNPKISIFFLAFLPQFVNKSSVSYMGQIFFFGGLFILTAFCVFSLISCFAGTLNEYFKQNPKMLKLFNLQTTLIYFGLGFKLLFWP